MQVFGLLQNDDMAVPSDAVPLLLGESVKVLVSQNVTYLCPYMGSISGKVAVTNYKLYFQSNKNRVRVLIAACNYS